MKIFNNAKNVLGFNPELISTQGLSKTLYNDTYKVIAELPLGEFKYAVWNLAKPKDFNGFVNENLNLCSPSTNWFRCKWPLFCVFQFFIL